MSEANRSDLPVGEQAIESARELLLTLHLEKMTGNMTMTAPVDELMGVLDNAIFAWDSSKPAQGDESRWRPWKRIDNEWQPIVPSLAEDAGQ